MVSTQFSGTPFTLPHQYRPYYHPQLPSRMIGWRPWVQHPPPVPRPVFSGPHHGEPSVNAGVFRGTGRRPRSSPSGRRRWRRARSRSSPRHKA